MDGELAAGLSSHAYNQLSWSRKSRRCQTRRTPFEFAGKGWWSHDDDDDDSPWSALVVAMCRRRDGFWWKCRLCNRKYGRAETVGAANRVGKAKKLRSCVAFIVPVGRCRVTKKICGYRGNVLPEENHLWIFRPSRSAIGPCVLIPWTWWLELRWTSNF